MSDCPLSPAEMRVLIFLSNGMAHKDIAAELDRSEMTITSHVRSSFQKTGTFNRHGLVAMALRKGWIK